MIDIMLPKVESVPVTDSDLHGRYHVEPLETGFGQTLGNALRRVLLSSLPGAAVTSIKIDEVYHEFSAISDIKEDTTELILNVKQIRLRSFSDRPVQCRIDATGPGQVTAADIICPPDVEIVNPELHIATLDGPTGHLSIELTVERGRGYIPADRRDGLPIGVIPVDAIYTPIRRVNYEVVPTRVGQETDRERLVIDVWTDGTITPDDAVAQSSDILVRHLELLKELVVKPVSRIEKQQLGTIQIPAKLYDTPIEDLDLTVRAYNCLKRAGITKVGQVLELSEDDLLGVRNFGRKSLDELRERLASRGLLDNSRLGMPTSSEESTDDEEIEPGDEETDADEAAELDPDSEPGLDESEKLLDDVAEELGSETVPDEIAVVDAEPEVKIEPSEAPVDTFEGFVDDDDESANKRRRRAKENRR